MDDQAAKNALGPVIEGLKASIPMQKAITNNLAILLSLKAYGYSNGFISDVLSKEAGKPLGAGHLASMMYRANKETRTVEETP